MSFVCYRMEELVILYYGNFSILGSQAGESAQRTGCSNRVADQTPEPVILRQITQGAPRLEHYLETGMGLIPVGAHAP